MAGSCFAGGPVEFSGPPLAIVVTFGNHADGGFEYAVDKPGERTVILGDLRNEIPVAGLLLARSFLKV